jgi:hypothetical protein
LLGCGRTPWAKAPKAGDAAEEGESAPGASFKDANESIWQSPSKNGDVTDVDEDARSIAATQPELARPASRPADAREDVGGDFGVVEPIMSSPIGRGDRHLRRPAILPRSRLISQPDDRARVGRDDRHVERRPVRRARLHAGCARALATKVPNRCSLQANARAREREHVQVRGARVSLR